MSDFVGNPVGSSMKKKAKIKLPKNGKGQMKPGSFQPTNPQY